MDYTIAPQYHGKKNCVIYVVRLTDKVSKDDFSTLADLARSHKGYYSTYPGVNGFVFTKEEEAEEFGEDMLAIMDTLQEVKKTPKKVSSKTTSKNEDIPLHDLSSGAMELHKAIKAIVQLKGESIITDVRLVNILDDFKAYGDVPASKYILRAIIADGFSQKLLNIGEWNNDAMNLVSRFSSTTGFMLDTVETLFKAIVYGLGWMSGWESNTQSCIPSSNPQSTVRPKPIGPRSNGWTKKMDEDQTDDFFQNLTEYDKSSEKKFQVGLENLYYTVEDSNLCFSLEISHNFKSEKTVSLYYALYNLKGRIVKSEFVMYVDNQSVNPKPNTEFTWKKASCIGKIRFYWQ